MGGDEGTPVEQWRRWLEYAREQGIEGLNPAPRSHAAPPPAAMPLPSSASGRSTPLPPLLSPEAKRRRMAESAERAEGCALCPLAAGRTRLVFGAGDPAASLVFVGEGPGADEDAQGIPFVGKAGQLLTKMIESIGWQREQVYICNVVKCRPPANRNPEPEEAEACWPYLRTQLEIAQPRLVVGLGAVAVRRLLGRNEAIGRVRGQVLEIEAGAWPVRFLPTFHPAYLLRSPGQKGQAMRDFFRIAELLEM